MFGFGKKLNLTSDDMADIHCQGIVIYNYNEPYPENTPDDMPHPVNYINCK